MHPDKKPHDYLKPPKGIDPEKELQFFLAASLALGRPSCGNVDRVRGCFTVKPDFVLRLKGVKGYLERGGGRPFYTMALQFNYHTGQISRLYVRYCNWYYRNEVRNEGAQTNRGTGANTQSK